MKQAASTSFGGMPMTEDGPASGRFYEGYASGSTTSSGPLISLLQNSLPIQAANCPRYERSMMI